MSSWVGKTLGKVRIESLLARGGMAEVYVGTHTTLERTVAVKILQAQSEDDQDLLDRFQREARVVAKLRPPNVVQVFDFDTIDNHPYLVMEYIEGPSLSKYLTVLHQNKIRLEIPQVVRILNAIASALQYAHEIGVIHRDVKPGNILLASRSSRIEPGKTLPRDFEPILTDFGLVRFLDSSRHTTVGHVAGTPAYMSPEQARGDTTDRRTDVYSLGVVLYEMLAGHLPFDGETTMSILLKHINEPPAPIPGLPPSIQAVLDRALAKEVKDRFQTPIEFAHAFEGAVEEIAAQSGTFTMIDSIRSTAPTWGAVKPLAPSKPRKKWMRSVLAGFLALTTIGLVLLINRVPPSGGKSAAATPLDQNNTPVTSVSSLLGPTGILHFRDGNTVMDRVVLSALAMPAPPVGTEYEVWLVGGEERLSLGILPLDGSGKGTLTFDHDQGLNLLSDYDQVEITLKPVEGSNPEAPSRVVYSYTLPPAGLEYVRRLLVSFPAAPEKAALIQGLSADTQVMDQIAEEMLSNYETGNATGTQEKAEAILNLLVGRQSLDFKDWNKDGQITLPGDGYGFLLNGDNLGYIQAVYSHADYAVNAPGASQNMIVNGGYVKVCAQNLALWAPQLRERVMDILTSASLEEMGQPVRDAVSLADRMLNGIDMNENEEIEPVTGECGVVTAYEYAYQMADMPLLPVTLTASTTPTAGAGTPVSTAALQMSGSAPTSSSGGGGGGGATSIPPASTKKPPPGQQNRPPKTPKK